MKPKPVWLREQPDILKMLHGFVDKLDKKPLEQWTQPPAVSVNEKILPVLFVQGERADQSWVLLKSLDQDYHIIDLRLNKKRNPLDPEYFDARVRLRDGAEAVLRTWLDRPYETPQLQLWRDAVQQVGERFRGETAKLLARPITLNDKSAEDIVQGFLRMADYESRNLTLRQLSALCFWGRSKFLDTRVDLVLSLYPDLALNQRPVVVNVFLPTVIEGVLFIENQDSYTCAMLGRPDAVRNLALVYSAGFRSSAERIRDVGGASLHFTGAGSVQHRQAFEAFWQADAPGDRPAWFWGDLDFAGMNILKQLIKRFPGLRAWQPGYALMLEHLRRGNGYAPGGEDQQSQLDPGTTGCDYADHQLLPALRQSGLFVDQEIVY